ncbi:stage III sporulation protein AC [Christensenella sp. MSJ-20]|jgi:stage III sporulation protein AC|uniref:stage III sporulation protein AC n=1 Tax=Christensenella sp. MSJ-20 TaxID=2841518 RepID=UPI000D7B2698|nr:MAG: stage III sporulation protein AC [Bacillota bacterium]QWT55675.1 stage III sporulation protein AC [Christensenella sp. MSJ-20]
MSIDLVFRLAAIGIIVAILNQLLTRAGRDDMATMVTIAGLILALFMVMDLISDLFESVKRIFDIY